MDTEATVFVVDDDESIRHSLRYLLESVKLRVATFDSAESFLNQVDTDQAGCLVLDVRMPGMSGLQLQQRLLARASTLPIIILTGHGDVPMAVRAMAAGSFDFIQKPFNGPQLLERIQAAIAHSRQRLADKANLNTILQCYQSLTPREKQIMDMIVAGKANKVMALDMGVTVRTIEVHRHRVMEKMQARSVADLIHAAMQLQAMPGNGES